MSDLYSRRNVIKIGLGGLASASVLGLAACDSTAPSAIQSASANMHMLFGERQRVIN